MYSNVSPSVFALSSSHPIRLVSPILLATALPHTDETDWHCRFPVHVGKHCSFAPPQTVRKCCVFVDCFRFIRSGAPLRFRPDPTPYTFALVTFRLRQGLFRRSQTKRMSIQSRLWIAKQQRTSGSVVAWLPTDPHTCQPTPLSVCELCLLRTSKKLSSSLSLSTTIVCFFVRSFLVPSFCFPSFSVSCVFVCVWVCNVRIVQWVLCAVCTPCVPFSSAQHKQHRKLPVFYLEQPKVK